MKKLVLIFFLLAGSLNLATAQLFVTTPNDTAAMTLSANTLDGLYIYQRNISGDTLNMAWTKVYESIPAGWDYSLCDKGTCYPGYPASGTMAITTATDSAFMATHVNPFTISGTLTVRFYVYDISAPTQGDTITFIYTFQNTAGTEDIATANFNMYPNPTSDYLQIATSHIDLPAAMTIYDMNGKVMLQTNMMQANEVIDITALPTGTFILEVANKYVVRKPFIKQ